MRRIIVAIQTVTHGTITVHTATLIRTQVHMAPGGHPTTTTRQATADITTRRVIATIPTAVTITTKTTNKSMLGQL